MAPNYYGGQCSGHGVCSSLGNIARRSYNSIYALWDKDQSTACVCDPGYYGADCHKRRCKRDLDPQYLDDVTTINFGRYYFPILTKRYEDSSDAAWYSGIPGQRGFFTIKYYDHEGQAYQTDRIYEGAECEEIIAKLEALPGNLIPTGMTACQKATVFNVSALEPRARLRMKYNSRGFLGFSVDHKTENPDKSVRADDIRKAIIKRLADLNDEDLISSVELDDTYNLFGEKVGGQK